MDLALADASRRLPGETAEQHRERATSIASRAVQAGMAALSGGVTRPDGRPAREEPPPPSGPRLATDAEMAQALTRIVAPEEVDGCAPDMARFVTTWDQFPDGTPTPTNVGPAPTLRNLLASGRPWHLTIQQGPDYVEATAWDAPLADETGPVCLGYRATLPDREITEVEERELCRFVWRALWTGLALRHGVTLGSPT